MIILRRLVLILLRDWLLLHRLNNRVIVILLILLRRKCLSLIGESLILLWVWLIRVLRLYRLLIRLLGIKSLIGLHLRWIIRLVWLLDLRIGHNWRLDRQRSRIKSARNLFVFSGLINSRLDSYVENWLDHGVPIWFLKLWIHTCWSGKNVRLICQSRSIATTTTACSIITGTDLRLG